MIADAFKHHTAGLDAPYTRAVAVTTSDTADLAFRTRALWIGGAGNLSVQWPDGTTSSFTGVAAGTLLRVRVDRVRATGTTATNIVALD